MNTTEPYLKPGLARPAPTAGLDQPFWDGLREETLLLQRCVACRGWQWGPELVCHRCHSFDLGYEETEASGIIYSHQRVWHPVHPALADQGPYVIVLVELPQADRVRMIGNLLGEPEQPLEIGAPVAGVYEHHHDEDPPFTLLQWVAVEDRRVSDDVLAANQAFYDAHEARDLAAMRAVWEHSDRVICVHPGWPILRTWPIVEQSWVRILGGPGRNQFILTNESVHVDGDVAWVTLDENLVAGEASGTIAATNMYVRGAPGWLLVLHHGSPVMG